MNVPTLTPVVLAISESEELKEFLGTPTGRKLQSALAAAEPAAVVSGGSAEFALGVIHGYRKAVATLYSFATLAEALQAERELAAASISTYDPLPPESD